MNARRTRTLTHAGVVTLTTDESGTVIGAAPNGGDPDPSPIGSRIAEHGSVGRVERPLVRASWLADGILAAPERRGRDDLIEVEWNTALDLVANALRAVIDRHGNEAVFGGSYGWASAGRFHHAPSQLKRFLNCIGGFTNSIGTYSHGAAEVVAPAVTGLGLNDFFRLAPSAIELSEATDAVISFGGFPAANTQITSGGDAHHWYRPALTAARDRGCRFVAITPTRTGFDDDLGATWVPILPGTDTALMLALVGELVAMDRSIESRLQRVASGADEFLASLRGVDDGVRKDASWAAVICGIPKGQILDLTRQLREPSRTLINATWSTQRVPQGEHAVWALVALGLAVGQLDVAGAGIAFGLGSMGSVGRALESPRLASLPQGTNPVGAAIPVSRLADALLAPGTEYTFAGQRRTYPQLEMLYWAGGNPFHHHQDLFRLDDAWRQPAAVIVHEPYLTATAQRADIVLPTTTGWERNDVGGASTGRHLVAMQSLPRATAGRDDYEIFTELARRFGVADDFTEGRSADEWLQWLYDQNRAIDGALPSWSEFQEIGMVSRSALPPSRPTNDFLSDPEAFPLRTPTGKFQLRLPAENGVPSHPSWASDSEARPSSSLALVSPMPSDRLHSQLLGNADDGLVEVFVHPDDADARNIASGETVTVSSRRGAVNGRAAITDRVRPGVISIANGRWFQPEPGNDVRRCQGGNVNALTSDQATSEWAQACAAHACPVHLEVRGGGRRRSDS